MTSLTSTMVETTTLNQCNHQNVLLNSTNVLFHTHGNLLPTPLEDVPSKRRPPTPDDTTAKRPRLTRPESEMGDSDTDSPIKIHAHRHTMFSLLQTSSRRPPSSSLRMIRMHPFPIAHYRLLTVCSKCLLALYCSPLYHLTDLMGSNVPHSPTIPL